MQKSIMRRTQAGQISGVGTERYGRYSVGMLGQYGQRDIADGIDGRREDEHSRLIPCLGHRPSKHVRL